MQIFNLNLQYWTDLVGRRRLRVQGLEGAFTCGLTSFAFVVFVHLRPSGKPEVAGGYTSLEESCEGYEIYCKVNFWALN